MHKTKVITHKSQVPRGYVRLRDLRGTYGKSKCNRISEAHQSGSIRAVKIMRTVNSQNGAVYVCMEDVEKFDSTKDSKSAQPTVQPTVQPTAHPSDSADIRKGPVYDRGEHIVQLLVRIDARLIKIADFLQRLDERSKEAGK